MKRGKRSWLDVMKECPVLMDGQLAFWGRSEEGRKRDALYQWRRELVNSLEGRVLSLNVAVAHVWVERKIALHRAGLNAQSLQTRAGAVAHSVAATPPVAVTRRRAAGCGALLGLATARWPMAPALFSQGGQPPPTSSNSASARNEVRPKIEADPLPEILREKVASRRLLALDRYCAGLDAAAVRHAMETLPADLGRRDGEVRERLMGRWAKVAPAEALEFATTMPNENLRTSTLRNVFSIWLHDDAAAAKSFVAAHRGEGGNVDCSPPTARPFPRTNRTRR